MDFNVQQAQKFTGELLRNLLCRKITPDQALQQLMHYYQERGVSFGDGEITSWRMLLIEILEAGHGKIQYGIREATKEALDVVDKARGRR